MSAEFPSYNHRWIARMEDVVQLKEEIERLRLKIEILENLERSATARACRLQAAREMLAESRDSWRRKAEALATNVARMTDELASLRAQKSPYKCCG